MVEIRAFRFRGAFQCDESSISNWKILLRQTRNCKWRKR